MIVEGIDGVRAPQAVKVLTGVHEVEQAPGGVGSRVRVTLEAEVTGQYVQGGQRITVLRPLAVAGVE